MLPEVFLKAVSTVRNLGNPLTEFTTVNFDFLQLYRPKVNVVERPHALSGGHGYAITGHHELMIPLLRAAGTLIEGDLMTLSGDREYPFWGYEELALLVGAVLPLLAVAALVVRVPHLLSMPRCQDAGSISSCFMR